MTLGLAELVGYLQVHIGEGGTATDQTERIGWTDDIGTRRTADLPLIVFTSSGGVAVAGSKSGDPGWDLFTRLGLQMLVITPLQKVWTIEPYVSAVGFAQAVGRRSEMLTMTIEEYRAHRAAHHHRNVPAPSALQTVAAASPSQDGASADVQSAAGDVQRLSIKDTSI